MISVKGFIITFFIGVVFLIGTISFKVEYKKVENKNSIQSSENIDMSGITPIEMYLMIEKYSDMYSIPKQIAYNVAFLETRYEGPFDWTYKHDLTSPVGAVGPMQVMVSTANYINVEKTTRSNLRENIEFNVETSMKLLNRLYKKYGRWDKVCGAYHTGSPVVNWYARFCVNNKDYTSNWRFYQI